MDVCVLVYYQSNHHGGDGNCDFDENDLSDLTFLKIAFEFCSYSSQDRVDKSQQ